MNREEFRFFERTRVRWVEVDMHHSVFNGHYPMHLDTTVAGYWRAMAMPYQETMAYLGGDLFVRKYTAEYAGSARYDDVLDIGVRCARVGNSSVAFCAGVFRGDTLLASAELVYVFANPTTQSLLTMPRQLRDALQAFEAGKPMINVRIGDWSVLGDQARSIRTAVFIQEQRIAAAMELDSADEHCVHALALNHFGMAVGTGRLLEHMPGVAKIGRMAVLQSLRGAQVGRAVLEALMSQARMRGDRDVLLHAQVSAVPFYLRAGFLPRGDRFDEAGIAHIEMVRTL